MNFDFCLLRKSNSNPWKLLLLAVVLLCFAAKFGTVLAGGKQGTNIVMTKDSLVLNDNHKKHSNNIVIKDGKHHKHHHCDCHEHHVFVPMHWGHWAGHHEHWGGHHHHHHKRSDPGNEWWGDMQLAASNQMPSNQQPQSSPVFFEDEEHGDHMDNGHRFNKQYENHDQTPFLQGTGNEALNSLIKQRYMNPAAQQSGQQSAEQPAHQYNQFDPESLHKISYPVFVKDDQN